LVLYPILGAEPVSHLQYFDDSFGIAAWRRRVADC